MVFRVDAIQQRLLRLEEVVSGAAETPPVAARTFRET